MKRYCFAGSVDFALFDGLNLHLADGEVTERLKVHDWKSCVR